MQFLNGIRLLIILINRYYAKYDDPIVESDGVVDEEASTLTFFKQKSKPKKDELQRYLAGDLLHRTGDPLDWWNANKYNFPRLSAMARDMLAIPATSASSERVFSGGRLVMPFNRTRLDSAAVRALMCLRHWLGLAEIESTLDDVE